MLMGKILVMDPSIIVALDIKNQLTKMPTVKVDVINTIDKFLHALKRKYELYILECIFPKSKILSPLEYESV